MTQPQEVVLQHQETPQQPSTLEAEIERIGSSDPYIVTQRERDLHQYLDKHLNAKICAQVLAAKGSGLSRALQDYRMQRVKRRGILQQIPTPVVYARIQQPGRPMDILLVIAEALGNDLRFGPLRDLRARVWGTLKAYGVKMLIVDNVDEPTLEGLNELVEIFENLKIAVILAATYQFHRTLERPRYASIYNSFLDFHDFRPLKKDETASVIGNWEKAVWREEQPLNLVGNQDVPSLLHERSAGLIRPLYESLCQIAIAKLTGELATINQTVLADFLSSRSKPKIR